MDEREGLPSASIVERLALCPGSLKKSQGKPELTTPEMQRYAESGDRVHLWLRAPDFVDLTPWPEELEVGQKCLEQLDQVRIRTFETERPTWTEEYVEHRFWLHRKDGTKRFSGQADRVELIITPTLRRALIVDYKTMRGDVAASPKNLQLRALAVLLWLHKKRKLNEIYVAIIQPLVKKEPEVTLYTKDDLKASLAELESILDEAEGPRPRLNPGKKQCQHCPARLTCEAAVDVVTELENEEIARLTGIAPGELSVLLDKCDAAEQVIKAARAHAKKILSQGIEIPNWNLKESSPMRSITDPEGVFYALVEAGFIDHPTFIKECVNVGVGDLEKGVQKFAEIKAKEAKQIVNKICAPFIELKPKQPSLERE